MKILAYFFAIFLTLICIAFVIIVLEYNIAIKITLTRKNLKNFSILNTNITSFSLKTNKLITKEYNSNTKFVLYPTDLCDYRLLNKTNQTKPFVIFAYMMVRLDSFAKRNIIRETWANRKLFPNLRLGFIVGKSNNKTLNRMIRNESLNFNDIIQGNFIDNYRNLTYKSLVAWKWIINYCSHAKIIVKIDDDLALNSNYLIKYFNIDNENNTIKNKTFYCDVCSNCGPIREKNSKWHASFDEYNVTLYNMTNYPTFCFGPSYIMSTDLIKYLYEQAFKVKFFWLEDVFTGLLAKNVQNVTHISINSKYSLTNGVNIRKDFILVRHVQSEIEHRYILKYIVS